MALSADENYLACTTHDGKIHVWDLRSKSVVQTYETGGSGNGSFGLSVDLSADGRLTASGHQNGSVYVFNNDAGHLKYSLSGELPGLCQGMDVSTKPSNRSRKTRESSRLLTRKHSPGGGRRCRHYRHLRCHDRRARGHLEQRRLIIGMDHLP